MLRNYSKENQAVRQLCEQIGYGRVMQIASHLWADELFDSIGYDGGALVVGECKAIADPGKVRRKKPVGLGNE